MGRPDRQQPALFYSFCPESLIPEDRPLLPIKRMAGESPKCLDERFARPHSSYVGPVIPPERLLKGLLLPILFSLRSKRTLTEHIRRNLPCRRFAGLDLKDTVRAPSTFFQKRDRLIEADIKVEYLTRIPAGADEPALRYSTHFSVDGTLLEAWVLVRPDTVGNPGSKALKRSLAVRPTQKRNAWAFPA